MRPLIAGILAVATVLPCVSAAPVELIVKPEKITVNGKETEVFTIVQPDGTRGLTVNQQDGFHVLVKNQLPIPTTIHWHGLILPNLQDGVPYVTQNPIPPGGQQEYRFPLVQNGTYWMHSHYGLQEQTLTSAPLIILNEEDPVRADRDVTVTLSDFSFTPPHDILRSLTKPTPPMETTKKNPAATVAKGMDSMKPGPVPSRVQTWDAAAKKFTARVVENPPADIDVHYDALLANRRSPDNAEVIPVQAGETVRVRFIASASATNFFVDTGSLNATLLAVDGKAVEPLEGHFFQLGLAQRIDLLVKIPDGGGAFPLLALGEGTRLQTGVILTTPGTEVLPIAAEADVLAGALDNTQEVRLRAMNPLEKKSPDRDLPSALGGTMADYEWTINGKRYPNRDSLDVQEGERVQMTVTNNTMMSHPMHLHGHDFQVVEIDGEAVNGALRDTVVVPPGGTTRIQFQADNPGVWAYHCHIIYHLVNGMFTVVKYHGADTTFWQPEKAAEELKELLP